MKSIKTISFVFICVLIFVLACACSAQDAVKDQIRTSTTWDENYFYVAVKVDDTNVRATHNKPNSDVSGDDRVTVYIKTNNKKTDKVNPTCFSMTVTAAGGAEFRTGNDAGVLEPFKLYTFKYGSNVQGTVNNEDDIDIGYSVEMAIPWAAMDASPQTTGDMMSFNVVVDKFGQKSGELTSLSEMVKTESDILNPPKWSDLIFASFTFGATSPSRDRILSAKYIVRPPTVNGVINEKEWNKNTSIAFDIPGSESVVYEAKYPPQKLVFSLYDYSAQGDKRKAAPVRLNKDIAKTDDIGPWVSYDRVDWHKTMLNSAQLTGVDVILPEFKGDNDSLANFALKGLDNLVVALDEQKQLGRSYPLIGLDLNVSSSDKDKIYNSIKTFFGRIPVEYLATMQTSKPDPGKMAYVVMLSKTGEVQINSELLNSLSQKFEADFGVSLVFVSADDKNPQWLFVDSSNLTHLSSNPFIYKEYSSTIFDASIGNVNDFRSYPEYSAEYLAYNIPSVIGAKQMLQGDLVIKNTGTQPWLLSDGYALSYRWYRNGRFFGESRIRRPISKDVQPGDIVSLNIGVAAVDQQSNPLPEDNYTVRFELIRLSDGKWFSTYDDQPLVVPIKISQPADFSATYLSAKLPALAATGSFYQASLKIRNDGAKTWKKGIVKLNGKLLKIDSTTLAQEEVPFSGVQAALSKDCAPGQVADFNFSLNLTQSDKKPLPAWSQDMPWSYYLAFNIGNGAEFNAEVCRRAIDIMSVDYGVKLVDSDIPEKLTKGATVDVRVALRNTGSQAWQAKRTKLGYHWFNENGTEYLWDGGKTQLPNNVQPGWPLMLKAKVIAPDAPGKYILVWDMLIDDNWLSSASISKSGDILSQPVVVE